MCNWEDCRKLVWELLDSDIQLLGGTDLGISCPEGVIHAVNTYESTREFIKQRFDELNRSSCENNLCACILPVEPEVFHEEKYAFDVKSRYCQPSGRYMEISVRIKSLTVKTCKGKCFQTKGAEVGKKHDG